MSKLQITTTVRAFAQELRDITSRIVYIHDDEVKYKFLSTLDEQTRVLVSLQKPSTFSEAESYAVIIDDIKHQNTQQSFQTTSALQPTITQPSYTSTPMDVDTISKFTPHEYERCIRLKLCLRCRREGHQLKDCTNFNSYKKPNNFTKRTFKPRRIGAIEDDDHSSSSSQYSVNKDTSIYSSFYSITNHSKISLFTIKVKIAGILANAMVDTGAQMNIISNEFLKLHNIKTKSTKTFHLRGFNNNQIQLSYETNALLVTYKQNSSHQTFLNSSIQYDLILGLP